MGWLVPNPHGLRLLLENEAPHAHAADRVLVVEDEQAIRQVWERFFQRWGIAADLAKNGREGLELARSGNYQMVITDLTMPLMSGQEMVRRIKSEMPELEIVVTTGQATIETAVEMMKAGAYDFITKPINFGSAEHVVRNCLASVAARKENVRLREQNRELEELNQIKQKFIAITSHELRTPVSVISNVVEAVTDTVDDPEGRSLLEMIETAALRLQEIVEEMHELSKLNSRDMVLRTVVFPLADLVGEVTEEFRLLLGERGHTLRQEIAEGLTLKADRVKLKKVLRELTHNAIKFTEDGGEIVISAAQEDDGGVAIEVLDTGIGIPPEARDHIFDLFYEVQDPLRHHSSKSEFQGGGMGIGLAIVNDIVQAHGGRVELENTAGKGSRFAVRLPVAPPEPHA